jgi:4-amino-4-deoxy-L-arabinose transferase-like glycosyltransferase
VIRAVLRYPRLAAIVVLLPLWLVGMFARCYWTPDEPREAALAHSFLDSRYDVDHVAGRDDTDLTIPHLGGAPYSEKPPLAYWTAAASMRVFGSSPAAARVPNLIYAILVVFAVGSLARRVVSPGVAFAAAIVAATFSLAFGTAVWLATDAALIAATTLALLAMFTALTTTSTRRAALAYLALHVAMAAAFMIKGIYGVIVPALTFLTFLVWEGRIRELKRPMLWWGLPLQLAIIGSWAALAAAHPDGREVLREIFVANSIGRFLPTGLAPAENYLSGHHNWPGKYLAELPMYLLPWTFLAAAAIRTAWRACRDPQPDRSAWRFALSCILPNALLLSVSATARNIYFAPLLPAFALLIALWIQRARRQPAAIDRFAAEATAMLLFALASVLCIVVLWFVMRPLARAPLSVTFISLASVGGTVALVLALRGLAQMRRVTLGTSYMRAGAAILLFAVTAAPAAVLVMNMQQDLSRLAYDVRAVSGERPVVLYQADETTLGFMDYYDSGPHKPIVDANETRARQKLRLELATHPDSCVLLSLPESRRPRAVVASLDSEDANQFAAALGLHVLDTIGVRRGRHYALLAAPASLPRVATATFESSRRLFFQHKVV